MSTQEVAKKSQGQERALVLWEDFQKELESREQKICSMLPSHIKKDRFMSSTIAAVQQTPGLLKATSRSLFSAIRKSAQDGLLPDGREGVILIFKDEAQWMPMTFGLRKRAREIDEIMVDAQVVYKNDDFIWSQGDRPGIEHTPAPLGVNRGDMIGAYAVFRNGDGILHREVMDADQIAMVKSQSRQPNGLLWGKFVTEAWRKTVVRRGFKSVPCSEKLAVVVQRDDDNYAFDSDPPMVDVPPRPERVAYQPPEQTEGEDFDARFQETMAESREKVDAAHAGDDEPEGDNREEIDTSGLTFVVDGYVIIYNGDTGEEMKRYQRAGNYFKALNELIANSEDPHATLDLNKTGANHFVRQDEKNMELYRGCLTRANEVASAAESME